MKQLLEYLTKGITGNKDITIEEQEAEGEKTYTIVAPKDVIGLLIGRAGRTIRALRTVARIRAVKDGEKIRIEVREKE